MASRLRNRLDRAAEAIRPGVPVNPYTVIFTDEDLLRSAAWMDSLSPEQREAVRAAPGMGVDFRPPRPAATDQPPA